MQCFGKILSALVLSTPFIANAAFVFSNVQITPHSVTFKINGDMTGYAQPADLNYLDQFSLIYNGGLWIGPTSFSPNTWSQSVFDNESIIINGNTGGFNVTFDYSWSVYSSSLADAVATDRLVTIDFGQNWLDPQGNGSLAFVWGNGSESGLHTVLQEVTQWNQSEIPEPQTLVLLGLGLAGLAATRRRRH